MTKRISAVAVAAATMLVMWAMQPTWAHAGSLYSGPGARPGPDILYAPLADAPQLDNAPGSVWRAPPILVSAQAARFKPRAPSRGH